MLGGTPLTPSSPPKRARESNGGYPHPILTGSNGNFRGRGEGVKRGFSQNKSMWNFGRRVRDAEARRPEDACPRAGSSYISAGSPSAQKDL
jgi:hypothetical protein